MIGVMSENKGISAGVAVDFGRAGWRGQVLLNI